MVDSVETIDYYKDNNTKLVGGLVRMSGDDRLHYSVARGCCSVCIVNAATSVDHVVDVVKGELRRIEDIQVSRRVDTPMNWCAGMVVVAKPRVVSSTVEGEKRRHIYV